MCILVNMVDFLGYIRKRRAELNKELVELDVAERVYRDSGVQMVSSQPDLLPEAPRPRVTIKQMVVNLLGDAHPQGLATREILGFIQSGYHVRIKRESLSPQLSRLKNDNRIYNDKGVWKIVKEDAPPEGEASNSTGLAGSPGKPLQVTPGRFDSD